MKVKDWGEEFNCSAMYIHGFYHNNLENVSIFLEENKQRNVTFMLLNSPQLLILKDTIEKAGFKNILAAPGAHGDVYLYVRSLHGTKSLKKRTKKTKPKGRVFGKKGDT